MFPVMKLAVIVLLLSGLIGQQQAAEIPLENPVRGAAEDQIELLPGYQATPFKQYSGYLVARENDKPEARRFLHYWLVEAEANSDYLFLWLNGGPGCSSISNLLRAIGPVKINQNGDVIKNNNSWNRYGNVLFIDSPVGTGFSYSPMGHIDSDDNSTLDDNFRALQSFYSKFPEYKEKLLHLMGESYAGVYLSMLAERIIDKDPKIKLGRIIIGNPYTDAKRLGESLVFYSYYHGLFDTADWRGISTYCCDGNTPDHKKCHFAATSVKCLEYITRLSAFILNPLPGLNPQNIYDPDYESPAMSARVRRDTSNMGVGPASRRLLEARSEGEMCRKRETSGQLIGKDLLLSSLQALVGDNSTTSSDIGIFKGDDETSGRSSLPFCANADSSVYHENYLNREDVKSSLHIPIRLERPFKQCARQIFTTYKQILPYQKGGIEPVVKKVLESNKNVSLAIFNGDVDLVANFIGNDWFTEELRYQVTIDHKPFLVDGKVGGFYKSYSGRVVYMTIKGAGHSAVTEKTAIVTDLLFNRMNSVFRGP